jgi:hypothetical protein
MLLVGIALLLVPQQGQVLNDTLACDLRQQHVVDVSAAGGGKRILERFRISGAQQEERTTSLNTCHAIVSFPPELTPSRRAHGPCCCGR